MPVDLTIDVGILMSGSGLGDPNHTADSLQLMKTLEKEKDWFLALDQRGQILHQYQEKVKRGFAQDWLRRLYTSGKLQHIPWKALNRGVKTALLEAHFDPEDYKYVVTAANTCCKVLVAHDPDYSAEVRRILARLSLTVKSAREAQG